VYPRGWNAVRCGFHLILYIYIYIDRGRDQAPNNHNHQRLTPRQVQRDDQTGLWILLTFESAPVAKWRKPGLRTPDKTTRTRHNNTKLTGAEEWRERAGEWRGRTRQQTLSDDEQRGEKRGAEGRRGESVRWRKE
jgi:hypothetical protein